MWSAKALFAVRLVVALLCAIMNGIELSFNVYAVLLKETFNFTQTEVEISASMACTGFGMAFLETFLTGVCGYTATFVVTWIGLPLTSGLISLAVVHSNFFHLYPVLLYFIQLCFFICSSMAYMVITRVIISTIPTKFTGTFIGLFGAFICFGKIVFAGMFDLFFQNDLSGFFVCLSVIFAVLFGLCYVLLYPVAMALENKPSVDADSPEDDVNEDLPVRDILRSPSFHMTFWTSAIFSGATFATLHNITIITDSLRMTDPFTTVTLISVCVMTSRFLYGVIFDKLSSKAGGFYLLFTTYISFGSGLLIGMFSLNTTTIHAVTVLTGIGIGPALYLPLAILVVQYGRSNYSPMSTALFASMSVCQVLILVIMGFLYDAKSFQLGATGNFCYGADCFFWTYVLLFSLTALVFIIQMVNFLNTVYCPLARYSALQSSRDK